MVLDVFIHTKLYVRVCVFVLRRYHDTGKAQLDDLVPERQKGQSGEASSVTESMRQYGNTKLLQVE